MDINGLERAPLRTVMTVGPQPRARFSGFVTRVLGSMLGGLLRWQQRASDRAHLASLTERHLMDVGLTRADVEEESAKPFWRL